MNPMVYKITIPSAKCLFVFEFLLEKLTCATVRSFLTVGLDGCTILGIEFNLDGKWRLSSLKMVLTNQLLGVRFVRRSRSRSEYRSTSLGVTKRRK